MTAVKPVLDTYLELNVVIVLSALIWLGARSLLASTSLRADYSAHLRVLKTLFLCILFSPLLALCVPIVFDALWPGRAVAIGDIAVAAYLRGDISVPATQFEAYLNARQNFEDTLLGGGSAAFTLVIAAMAVVGAMLVFRVILAAVRIRETVNSSYLWRSTAKVDVRLSDRIVVPFAVRGVFRRHVVIPSHLLDKPNELRFAISHEFQHVRACDVEWELALELMRPLFFWNPAYHVLKYQFERLRELGCDQSIVERRRLDTSDYANCLLDYCARTVSGEKSYVFKVALVTGGKAKRVLRQRVLALADASTGTRQLPAIVFAVSLVFGSLLAVGSASLQQTDDWSHDRIMLSTVVNLERLAERSRGN
ncbi:MAG: M56 family metallopeptidase [Ruegeria sp.]